MKLRALALSLCLALSTLASIPSAASAQPAPVAASASATQRWTFDGAIRNNSLALSPDEGTAVVSYSERPDVVVYDLKAGKVRAVLNGLPMYGSRSNCSGRLNRLMRVKETNQSA